jgi:hypothetical protein
VPSRSIFADAVAAIGKPDIAINTVGKKTAFFFIQEAGEHLNDNGKLVTLVTSLLGAFELCGHQGAGRTLYGLS